MEIRDRRGVFSKVSLQHPIQRLGNISQLEVGLESKSNAQMPLLRMVTLASKTVDCRYFDQQRHPSHRQVWCEAQRRAIMAAPAAHRRTITDCWLALVSQMQRPNGASRCDMGMVVYLAWHVWKERCRRVFQNIALTPHRLVELALMDYEAFVVANRGID